MYFSGPNFFPIQMGMFDIIILEIHSVILKKEKKELIKCIPSPYPQVKKIRSITEWKDSVTCQGLQI